VRETAPGVQPVESRFEPAAGVVLLALASLRIEPDDALLGRMESTLPGAAFFAT
jgi:hypothetical protein